MSGPLHNLALRQVTSSNVKAVGFHPETGTLVVEFKSGSKYAYHGVTDVQAKALEGAESVGGHFAKHIRPHFVGVPL